MQSARKSNALEALATRSRERAIEEGARCPDDETWALLAEDALSNELTDELRRHAERCESCHLALAGLGLVGEPELATARTELGTTALPPAGMPAQKLVGRYVVEATLGEGGMGVVYKAYDPELERHVALKLLKPSASAGRDELVVRLQREARSMAKLSHPNVVTVYDVGMHDGALYVAMELVKGGTLAVYLGEAKPPLVEIVRCFRDVARALAAAHDSGLVHRDLKPQNVLVSQDVVKVSDFGLARPASGPERDEPLAGDGLDFTSTAITRTGQIVGTPAYMAPEQFAGKKTDGRTDVFAFGVALYEALFGSRPFPGASIPELRANVLSGRRRAPASRSDRDAEALAEIERLIDGCLAGEPARRPSMREMEHALDRLRSRLLSLGGAPRAVRPSRARVVGAAIVVVAIAVAAVSLAGLSWRRGTEASAAPRVEERVEAAPALPRAVAPSVEPAPTAFPSAVPARIEAKPRARQVVKTPAPASSAPQLGANSAPILR